MVHRQLAERVVHRQVAALEQFPTTTRSLGVGCVPLAFGEEVYRAEQRAPTHKNLSKEAVVGAKDVRCATGTLA